MIEEASLPLKRNAMSKFLKSDLLSICLIISCIAFGISLVYLYISESASRERMVFFLITVTAFISCITFVLLIKDARKHEEENKM